MFIPLHDKNPLDKIRFQYVTLLLILANVVIYVFFQSDLIYPNNIQASFGFALVPSELHSANNFLDLFLKDVNFFSSSDPVNSAQTTQNNLIARSGLASVIIPEGWTLLSYMFLHASIWHLLGNMAFLWVFGDNVEDAMGHFRFLIFYLLCGVFAGLAHSLYNPLSQSPLIGASGAVSGVIAAYLILHPNIRVWVLAFWRIPLPLPAGLVLGFWIGMQFVFFYLQHTGQVLSNTAWVAHVGGLVAGAVLIVFMKRRGWKLFDFQH
ncbi:MAG: rhomboid family intramembrane serine protease [Methyloligellaceae bacterium]